MDPTIVSAAATNQWAMDFDKNTERIIETIKIAKL